jgi:hypothetical protein
MIIPIIAIMIMLTALLPMFMGLAWSPAAVSQRERTAIFAALQLRSANSIIRLSLVAAVPAKSPAVVRVDWSLNRMNKIAVILLAVAENAGVL